MRIQRMLGLLREDIDGVLVTSECNIKYLTGFDCDAGVLLACREGSVFFTDSRYTLAAKQAITFCEVLDTAYLPRLLPEQCKRFSAASLAGEASRLTVANAGKYAGMLGDVRFVLDGSADSAINALRSVKDAREVACIKQAQEIAEAAFSHILGFIREGVTQRDIRLELDFFMMKNGAREPAFDTIAISGTRTAMPHGVPTDEKVCRGDFVTLDFGADFGGYKSDMTRTVAVGCVSDEQREIYNIVLSAQSAALCALKAGLSCKSADAAARDIIANAGCGDFFGHGTGHSVGLEIHELPALSPRSGDILKCGNIVTVEPGIYLPDKFGVRIEDMALITQQGCENLTHSPKELIII